MTDFQTFVLFLSAALLIAITPGPGIFYVAARTLAGGRAEGLASSFGTGVGGLFHVVAAALGVSALVLASAEAFTALKLAGAVYLIWLGLKTWREARIAEPRGVETTGTGRAHQDASDLGSGYMRPWRRAALCTPHRLNNLEGDFR